MSKKFSVEEFSELLALQRVFREAKFCTEPDDAEVADSPVVARLFERLIVTLIENDVEREGEDARLRWSRWLAIDEYRDEWAAAIRRAKTDARWLAFSDAERTEYVSLLLSPFTLSPELIEKFILAVSKSSE